MNTTKKVTGENKLIVKHFNSVAYNDKLLRANNTVIESGMVVNAFKKFELKTLEEVESMLIERTGFPNLRLAAQALNLENEYLLIRDTFITDFSIFNEDYTALTDEFKNKLREENTTYYTAEETKVLKQAEKLIAEYNNLNLAVKGSIAINREGDLVMNESKYNYLSQSRF